MDAMKNKMQSKRTRYLLLMPIISHGCKSVKSMNEGFSITFVGLNVIIWNSFPKK